MNRVAVLAAALLLASTAKAAANPADVTGFGARGSAMAGAQVATTDPGAANYYNAARLVGDDDIHLDVGYQINDPRLVLNGERQGLTRSSGLAIDLVVPGRLLGQRLAIGAGIFLPDQHATRTRALAANRPRFLQYDNRSQRLFLAANAAFAITPTLSIGAGISYMSSTVGTVQLRGLVGFPNPSASDLELAIDVDLQTIRYPQAGLAWQPTPWLRLGASYRGGFRLKVDQTFDISGDVGAPGFEPLVEDGYFVLRSISQDLFQPAQITVGGAAQITPKLELALDVGWHRWSTFENPAAQLSFDIDVGDFNDLIDLPPPVMLPEPNLRNIIVPRLGAEFALTPSTMLRAGYLYEPAVAPPQTDSSNFVDNNKHTISVGAGKTFAGIGNVILRPVSLDAFVAATILGGRDHIKTSPIDPIGSYRSGGMVLSMGLTSRWRF